MKDRKPLHPIWMVLCLLFFPPLGLIVLGEQKEIKPFFKICIAVAYGLLIMILVQQYRLTPRTNSGETIRHETEQVQYQFVRVVYPIELPNGMKEMVQKEEDETWVQIFLEVTNIGKKSIYYISLLDNPVLITETGSIDPDLSLSYEPFGEVAPQETRSGYLVFRVSKEQKPLTFQIASYSASLQ